MASTSTTTASGGIGFTGLLQIAFIILKLCGVITWSWWWVLSPALISTGLFVVALFIMVFAVLTGRK